MRRLTAAVMVLSFCAGGRWGYGDTVVSVKLLQSDDLPSLSDATHQRILRRASQIVKDCCDLEIDFRVDGSQSVAAFLAERRRRIAPYQVAPSMAWDLFETTPERYRTAVAQKIRACRCLAQLRAFMPNVKSDMSDEQAGLAIAEAYSDGIRRFTTIQKANGEPLLRRENWKDHSLGHWAAYVNAQPWQEGHTLYLSNWILAEDALDDAPLLILERGGIVNALTLPASHTVIVAYGSILSDELASGNPRLKGMTAREKEQAIAYVIAQQFGAYLLKQAAVNYSLEAGLVRPIQTLGSVAELYLKDTVKVAGRKGETLDLLHSKICKTLTRMDVYIAQGHWSEVIEEARRLDNLTLDAESEMQVLLRIGLAEEQIERERRRLPGIAPPPDVR
jgi:hypothetical protein